MEGRGVREGSMKKEEDEEEEVSEKNTVRPSSSGDIESDCLLNPRETDHKEYVDEDDDEYEEKNEAGKIGLAVSREKKKIRGARYQRDRARAAAEMDWYERRRLRRSRFSPPSLIDFVEE